MEISSEHILYTNDLDKAIGVFTDSFGEDIPEVLLKSLLLGTHIVTVDEKDQCWIVVERQDHPQLDSLYPAVLDIPKFVAKKEQELIKHCKNLDRGLDAIINKFRYKDTFRLDISVKAMMKYIYGRDDEFIADVMDEMEYDDDVQQMKALIRITKDFIEKSVKLSKMIARLGKMYDVKTQFVTYDLTNLAQKVQQIARAEFTTYTEGETDVNLIDAYMEASKQIDEVIETGLQPVDIMDNYSAGWLSPSGDYYALNGEIANMLHIQISQALQEQGMIPRFENNDPDNFEINPDAWLEQHGWVKIHDNNVQFSGCLNNKLTPPKKDIHMTDKQKKIIYEYIQICHGGIVRLGWRLEKISAARFQMTDDLMLAKHYFSFD